VTYQATGAHWTSGYCRRETTTAISSKAGADCHAAIQAGTKEMHIEKSVI
jgi:hypothetical protein